MNERDLFFSALEIDDPAARRAHLQAACADNGELLSRVESLLASHEGESRFLQTPVGEQLGDDPTGQAAATLVMGTGSTHDESPSGEAASILDYSQLQERTRMLDEIPLGYLEPSTKPGSLGRLAHYEILEVIGQGAFGTVLRAFDEKLQRVVAIKVMAPELAATSPARKRFVREAQASAQIRHENVVSVYSVEEKPIPYLVMEYIPGVTLQQRLDERGPLEVLTVLRLGRQIAEGLAAAHAKDLIHRDIKPGNILLETGVQDRVKITDFGLARAADDASMSQSGVIAGTPMYMAPEQALGHKLDQRADLFSLGSVLYQMVSGRPPFRASSTLAVLKRLTEETPRPIKEIIPETPRWLCDIISKLHAKNPDDRFHTAKEVAELLEQHSAHLQNPSQVIRPAAVSLAPAAKAPADPEMRPLMVPQGIRWPLLIATAIMFLIAVLLLAVTESTGVTHLFTGAGVAQGPSPPIAPKPGLIEIKELRSSSLPPTFKNSIGMEFVVVPKGKSWLGGSNDKLGDKEVETSADFYLGKYEVTQEEWTQVMGQNPSWLSRTGGGKEAVKDISDADLKRFPVENVSWDQCRIFVAKLNKLEKETGWVYRLPTEVEWEYACRGGPLADTLDSAFDFYFAKPTNSLLPDQANFNLGLKRTCKVGSYAPNVLGLFDMHGNVWEWCDDTVKPAEGPSRRMARGGSWGIGPELCRASYRETYPQLTVHDGIGLRLARVPSGIPSPEANTPPLAADVLKDAVLVMDFEKDTFYEKDGKTYVRDRSGRGNDGVCEDVSFTPDGKAGGGLACQGGALRIPNSLIHGQANYTITGWCRSDAIAPPTENNLYDSASERSAIIFNVRVNGERSVRVNAWNKDKDPENWLDSFTKDGVVPDQGWYFFAVSMRDGGVGTGTLRVTVDQATYSLDFQMVKKPDGVVVSDLIGRKMSGAVLDELTVFQRTLTDQEIAAVRALGLKGTPLNVGNGPLATPPPPTFKNTLGMEFVIVPKGKSWLGGGNGKLGDKEVEIPADFYLGKYEVTQEEWEKVIEANPSDFSRSGASNDAVKDIPDADLKRFPVENVSWQDCQFFVERLNKLEKETDWVYRLPKEAEWEYACRGGPMSDKLDSVFSFFFAKLTNSLLPEQANFNSGTEQNRIGLNRPCKVGSYAPNKLGLYDMHGNVWEWCEDTIQGTDRVCRGGGWLHLSEWGAERFYANPPSYRTTTLGLRLARVPSGAPSPEGKTPPVTFAPFPDADVKRIAALPAEQQIEEVRKELMKRNPGLDGTAKHKIEGGVVTEFVFTPIKGQDALTDLSPVRALVGLTYLNLWGCSELENLEPLKGLKLTRLTLGSLNVNLQVRDLEPLRGMKLTELRLYRCQVQDLEPLQDMPLTTLSLFSRQVRDCGPLRGMPLTTLGLANCSQIEDFTPLKDLPLTVLHLNDCQVRDLEPFKDMKLISLHLVGTPVRDLELLKGMPLKQLSIIQKPGVTDLRPLQGMELEEIYLTPKNITQGLDILRGMKSLKTIGIAYSQAWPAAEFWERYDKGEFKE